MWWYQAAIDLEGTKKMAAEAATVLESESESYLEYNEDSGREEESKGAIRSSGAEWNGVEQSGVGQKSNPPRKTTGRKHGRGGTT